ncbi:3-hydroxyacyl-CoA dehydrogenase NAD-binding domain-containing protein [Oceanicella actignis]|uniref:L-carnitine dehydrogenase n=1 Tax=Oceanicella actignis TaxID=1189325 RepID=A0A1M7TWY1_9RHOB|nr:3-hydroxyacyl-CoA dehydrogenase NAD-binding domain-containing protein [Oceanicella actignis]SET79592.1 carnitine 3-dehydrogenase [Oceanicella actignis]SHN75195.1 carnitine 3-dehydrogenase [Oceanicella actignis]
MTPPAATGAAPGRAAIIGAGVIGAGWAARFALNGWDVAVHDPSPNAPRAIARCMENARAAWGALFDAPLPPEGRVVFARSTAEAVEGADYVQESVSESLDLKRRIFADIQAAAPDAPLGSSTSGFTPSDLQRGARAPGSILVAHPFNPVYLLPLVETVGSAQTDPALMDAAEEILRGLGMFPLRLRKEIDAHIADRLLEAVWREALWLVRDGVATTEEIDEAIRLGFGLRWAQMGLFETYRIAGGEAGMRHFLAQFGPCLALPWTRLTDVPPFDERLVELIAAQSDAQSGRWTIAELERIRDSNLTAFLRALRRADWGAGKLVAAHEGRMRAVAAADRFRVPAGENGAPDPGWPLAIAAKALRAALAGWDDAPAERWTATQSLVEQNRAPRPAALVTARCRLEPQSGEALQAIVAIVDEDGPLARVEQTLVRERS